MGGEGCRVRRREGEGVITHMTRRGEKKEKKSREDEEGEWRREKYLKATALIQFVMHILDVKTRDT